ncbi:hypothetical protein L227DRAFT_604481 [Lentinus tigrinus ALCF2SS1-6]|uniref:HNH nuclease domain-containing protein n=1 Tax=Lentinus tigrinus ALCF2SS1-6 TaxID=1328759 RepID=A0A5C2RPZ9_9APHY|nr:hypothetical protein L227DRAFT_604481 [Lentinus tigrinus ALCF2SS1-6]
MPLRLPFVVPVLPVEPIVKAILAGWDLFWQGLLSGDLQWLWWIWNGTPMWTLSDRSLTSYIKLQEVASTIVNDPTLSDHALAERARAHLQILERPEFAKWNHLQWLADIGREMKVEPRELEELVSAATARRFFDAMMQTADEFNLRNGRRHACAETQDPLNISRGLLVVLELHTLLFMVWWHAMWYPCPPGGPADILRRDNYTCFMTGTVDERATWARRVSAKTVGQLYIVPIFTHQITDPCTDLQQERSRLGPEPEDALTELDDIGGASQYYKTLNFFRTFGEIPHDGAQVSEVGTPQNCLLLERKARLAFRHMTWTLVATTIPNTYKIRSYTSPDGACSYGTSHIHEYVTFTEPTGSHGAGDVKSQGPGTLPDPNLLRAHAIFANVIHLSGMGFMCDTDRWLRS